MQEALSGVDSRVERRTDHEHRWLERLGSGRPEHLLTLQRSGAHRRRDLGRHGGERVEHLDTQLEHARGLDGPHARGQRRTQDHRDLASEFPWKPDSDHALGAVDKLRQLRLPLDHDRQESTFAFVGYVFPGSEVDVLDGTGEVLQLILRKRREERNRGQLSDSNHNAPTPSPAWRPRSPSNSGYDHRTRLPSI